jgi:hypothetical protein
MSANTVFQVFVIGGVSTVLGILALLFWAYFMYFWRTWDTKRDPNAAYDTAQAEYDEQFELVYGHLDRARANGQGRKKHQFKSEVMPKALSIKIMLAFPIYLVYMNSC